MNPIVTTPKLPETSIVPVRSAAAPQTKTIMTIEERLRSQLAAVQADKRMEETVAGLVRKKRALERKQLAEKGNRIKELRKLLVEKDINLAQEEQQHELQQRKNEQHEKELQLLLAEKDIKIAMEPDERKKLSKAFDELCGQLEAAKRHAGVYGVQLLQLHENKDQEAEELRAELVAVSAAAKRVGHLGVEMGTQTDEDGVAKELAMLKRRVREFASV